MANTINTNMVSVTRMTGLVLPGMVKREKGVIINIGSGSSMIPSPLLAVYAASKVPKAQNNFIVIVYLPNTQYYHHNIANKIIKIMTLGRVIFP